MADRLRFSTAMSAGLEPVDEFLAFTPALGRTRYDVGHDVVTTQPGRAVRYPDDVAITGRWDDAIDARMVRLPLSVVERVAEERFGPLAQRLRFTGMTPTSRPLEDAWLRTAALVHEALSGPHPLADEPLLSTHLVQTVAWAALRAFPNTTTTLAHRAGPGLVGAAVVRRAMQFIEDHASLPITVTDIATAAGVDGRSLDAGFRRHLGCTPGTHLQWVRLTAARQDLQQTDPSGGATVAQVAHRWGFARVDRFVASFRDEFGVHPEDVLRN